MTLEPYTAEQLDALSLRVLDLAVIVRSMANRCRQEKIEGISLHDRKALEWLERLEDWGRKGAADLDIQILRNQASRQAKRTKAEQK